MKVDTCTYKRVHIPTLTQCLYTLSLLGAGFVTELTTDVVEGEENVMLLMNMDWQFNFNLHKKK